VRRHGLEDASGQPPTRPETAESRAAIASCGRGPESLLAAARIPKRYEHCELASYTTDFPGAHPSLALAHLSASRFAQEYDPRDGTGLLIIGKIGTGKTHLAVGITKDLINKGVPCLFYDYRELLKQIQNSYNAVGSNHGAGRASPASLKLTSWFWTNWAR
jgi:DNA replication protein DnaC